MNILITGANGFIGKNLTAALKNIRDGKDTVHSAVREINIFEYDTDTDEDLLYDYCKNADFIFHLAGVNRPKEITEFADGNFGFTSKLLDILEKYKNTCPVMISSSIQAVCDNPYGNSKKAAEGLLEDYSERTGAKVLIYRFPNVFGKWSRPNYNSVIATFCHNIARDLPITVNDPSAVINLAYIDDVTNELINAVYGNETYDGGFCHIPVTHKITLGEIADLLYSFKNSRTAKSVPNTEDEFTKKLYATYLSFLPEDEFSYPLKMNCDNRGSFTEIIRTADRGQYSINVSKPGVVKGNHWHNTKNEKFIVVSGKGVIRFRKIGEKKVYEYFVSADKTEVVDIPPGYTHNIENLGNTDMVTLMWANECFNPDFPDTYYEEV